MKARWCTIWLGLTAVSWGGTLEVGSTLCLSDEMSPGICRNPTDRFCVIMPMRVAIPAVINPETANPPLNKAQAAA